MVDRLADLPLAVPRRGAIPLADAGALRFAIRRTTLIRLGLLALLVLLASLAVWRAARLEPRPVSFLPRGSTTIVVIDQSKSVYVAAYKRIAATLRKLVVGNASIGLIAFSDTAYEMMPPGSRGAELKPLLRFYSPTRAGSNIDPSTEFAGSPWNSVFSGGTKISSGLVLARSILTRDRIKHGTILLVSDLETAAEDQPTLAQELIKLSHDPDVELRIVPLFPVEQDQVFFQHFVGRGPFVNPRELAVRGRAEPRRILVSRKPWPLIVAGALLLFALAANELLGARVHVARPKEAAA